MMPLARLAAKMSRTGARTARHKGLPGMVRTGTRTDVIPARSPEVRQGRGPLGLLQLWWWRVTSRHELAQLDREQLRDVGIHPRAALRESQKPFWRA